jgi:uroporphyrinogen decarboxylase
LPPSHPLPTRRMRRVRPQIISLDWSIDMARGREILGADRLVQGNVDPTILFGDDALITEAVHANIRDAGGPGKHLLNLGHGVLQGTPESAVLAFVEAAKSAK